MMSSKARILQLVEEDIFSAIDFYFAKALVRNLFVEDQDNHLFLLC